MKLMKQLNKVWNEPFSFHTGLGALGVSIGLSGLAYQTLLLNTKITTFH